MAAVSNKPWSDFSEADYTIDQLARACLINLNTGPKSGWSKSKLKLRVREPDGTLNRNAVYAAASVLGGGRGGVDAPPAEKRAAARALLGLYRMLNQDAPASLRRVAA